jgi:hypothetical protein
VGDDLSTGGLRGGLNRRQLFGLGASSLGIAALLAACGGDEPPEPGRVGFAPDATDLPEGEVDDAVLLRTLTSLDYSIVEVYTALAAIDGLDDGTVELLERLIEDHTASAEHLASLTSDAGGESYECANTWLMGRTLQPLIDHIVGSTNGEVEIPPSDDADRDSLSSAVALETMAAATAQQYLERLVDPALRTEVIRVAAEASRRAATAALRSNPPPAGYVSPTLTEGAEIQPDEEGFMPWFAIASRFGQLTPVELVVGAADEVGQRFSVTLETPAENAFVYADQTCS